MQARMSPIQGSYPGCSGVCFWSCQKPEHAGGAVLLCWYQSHSGTWYVMESFSARPRPPGYGVLLKPLNLINQLEYLGSSSFSRTLVYQLSALIVLPATRVVTTSPSLICIQVVPGATDKEACGPPEGATHGTPRPEAHTQARQGQRPAASRPA